MTFCRNKIMVHIQHNKLQDNHGFSVMSPLSRGATYIIRRCRPRRPWSLIIRAAKRVKRLHFFRFPSVRSTRVLHAN